MMPSDVHDARKFNFLSQDEILFDTNIWLYLEGPPGAAKSPVEAYSRLLEQILVKGNVLVIAPLVLSEFINRYLGMMRPRGATKKEYRETSAYTSTLKDISQACQNILGLCQRTVRSSIGLDSLKADLATFSAGSHDVNDLFLARLCQKEKLIFVTHDADFAKLDGLTIVTANQAVLRR